MTDISYSPYCCGLVCLDEWFLSILKGYYYYHNHHHLPLYLPRVNSPKIHFPLILFLSAGLYPQCLGIRQHPMKFPEALSIDSGLFQFGGSVFFMHQAAYCCHALTFRERRWAVSLIWVWWRRRWELQEHVNIHFLPCLMRILCSVWAWVHWMDIDLW